VASPLGTGTFLPARLRPAPETTRDQPVRTGSRGQALEAFLCLRKPLIDLGLHRGPATFRDAKVRRVERQLDLTLVDDAARNRFGASRR